MPPAGVAQLCRSRLGMEKGVYSSVKALYFVPLLLFLASTLGRIAVDG